eukprot:5063218-Amphidinium_carterae.1
MFEDLGVFFKGPLLGQMDATAGIAVASRTRRSEWTSGLVVCAACCAAQPFFRNLIRCYVGTAVEAIKCSIYKVLRALKTLAGLLGVCCGTVMYYVPLGAVELGTSVATGVLFKVLGTPHKLSFLCLSRPDTKRYHLSHRLKFRKTRGQMTGCRMPKFWGLVVDACEEFLGIPFAEPPARFQSPAPWTTPFSDGKFVADNFSNPCMQVHS